MATSAEWVHVLALASIWAIIFGVALFNLRALRTKGSSSRKVWLWFGALLLFVGLSSGMVQTFGWSVFQGGLLLILAASLVGLYCSGFLFYRRMR
jgi:hypothetical protein